LEVAATEKPMALAIYLGILTISFPKKVVPKSTPTPVKPTTPNLINLKNNSRVSHSNML